MYSPHTENKQDVLYVKGRLSVNGIKPDYITPQSLPRCGDDLERDICLLGSFRFFLWVVVRMDME